jgi:hypothetical protein
MPFSVSIGDVIAITNLIAEIAGCLRNVGGARSDYQELLRELEILQKALAHLDSLQPQTGDPTNLDSIKLAALSCRQPLEEFLRKIQRYEDSLGINSSRGALKNINEKIQWNFGEKDAVDRLRKYLSFYVALINMLLVNYGLQSMNIANEQAVQDSLHIRERLEGTHTIVENLQTTTRRQSWLIHNMNSLVTQLFEMVSGDLRTSWQMLFGMVAKVW